MIAADAGPVTAGSLRGEGEGSERMNCPVQLLDPQSGGDRRKSATAVGIATRGTCGRRKDKCDSWLREIASAAELLTPGI